METLGQASLTFFTALCLILIGVWTVSVGAAQRMRLVSTCSLGVASPLSGALVGVGLIMNALPLVADLPDTRVFSLAVPLVGVALALAGLLLEHRLRRRRD